MHGRGRNAYYAVRLASYSDLGLLATAAARAKKALLKFNQGRVSEFQYPPPKEIVPNSLWVAEFVSDSTPCNIRLGNAASYPPRDPNELFKESHDPTVNATIDVQAEATGSFMPAPASGISQPTGSIFPLDDITPGEFDWSTWISNDGLEFEYLFDQDGQARPFAPSTPAPG